MWQLLIKPTLSLVSTAIKGKQRIKEAEVSAKEKAIAAKETWELEAIRASSSSWKDEAWTILFVSIVAACFIPGLQDHVFKGFEALEQTPTWFQIAIGMSISASFGIKAYNLFKK